MLDTSVLRRPLFSLAPPVIEMEDVLWATEFLADCPAYEEIVEAVGQAFDEAAAAVPHEEARLAEEVARLIVAAELGLSPALLPSSRLKGFYAWLVTLPKPYLALLVDDVFSS